MDELEELLSADESGDEEEEMDVVVDDHGNR